MGQPDFQVSFNECEVYLGHFSLKVSLYKGTPPPVASEWAVSCLMSLDRHVSCASACPAAHLPSLSHWTLLSPLWVLTPPGRLSGLGFIAIRCDARRSLWCRLFRSPAIQSLFCRTYSLQGMFFKNGPNQTLPELLHTFTSSWRATTSSVKTLHDFL